MEGHRSDDAGITRRQALRGIGIAGLGAAGLGLGVEDLIGQALAAAPRGPASLGDIEHVVIFMQENRSFDHYFGTYAGVRGFGDKSGVSTFHQRGLDGRTVLPWQLTSGCIPDVSHRWTTQHKSWNHGRMNRFVTSRIGINGAGVAPETMGYYTAKDLPLYHALANAFTLCDGYHCSVIGPTDPNRLMSMTATIDPDGRAGGPQVQTYTDRDLRVNRFSWTTMPERLQAKGVSWKVYTGTSGGDLDNVLTYFKAYNVPGALADRGVKPVYPDDFLADLTADRLPRVSWLLANVLETDHPGFSTPLSGEIVARQIVEALVSHPKVWRKTAMFLTWDENGGLFDHVPPVTAPRGTPGEWLTVSKLPHLAGGIRGPIGLGFRVPLLVISPFSHGGLVCPDRCDHTSTLRFLETRFGVRVPNLSDWRRRRTGDLTTAFNFAARPRTSRPRLPSTPAAAPGCFGPPPLTVEQHGLPKQQKGTRKRPSGMVAGERNSHR